MHSENRLCHRTAAINENMTKTHSAPTCLFPSHISTYLVPNPADISLLPPPHMSITNPYQYQSSPTSGASSTSDQTECHTNYLALIIVLTAICLCFIPINAHQCYTMWKCNKELNRQLRELGHGHQPQAVRPPPGGGGTV